MNNNYYKSGSWNIICDRCGRKYKKEQCKKEWQGLIVCQSCYDPKHPVLEPLPVVLDSLSVPDARPRPTALYVTAPEGLDIWGQQYTTIQGVDPSATWDSWISTWDGNSSSDNFIIGT